MNFRWLTLIALVPILGMGAPMPSDLDSFRKCVVDFRAVDAKYAKIIPQRIFNLDRNLFLMRARIPYLDKTGDLLEQQLKSNSASKFDQLMVANATASCQAAVEQYAKQLQSLSYFMLSALCTLLMFIFYLFLLRMPMKASVPPAEDQPQDKIS